MTDLITAFMAAIPAGVTKFYEEATETADFPFVVASGFNVEPLDFGYQVTIDLDHWSTEGSGKAAALETQCNTVREAMDGLAISKTGSFRGVIYFENQQVIIDGEQDLIRRRQTYIVRAFFM